MKYNVGSQKAISIGLDYLKKNERNFCLTIMDGDGEDDPKQINKMFKLAKNNKKHIITSNRTKRNENYFIKICYRLHLIITYLFAWEWISFGNFSAFHSSNLRKINLNKVWYAYPSAILMNCNIIKIFSTRQKRFYDISKVGMIKLVEHSFRIISVFYLRVLITSSTIIMISVFIDYSYVKNIFILFLILFNFQLVLIMIKHKLPNKVNFNFFIKSILTYK